jgi:hypothetical protein
MPWALALLALDEDMFTTAGKALSTTGAKLVSIDPGVTIVGAAAATGASAGGCAAQPPEPIAAPTPADTKQNAKILLSFQRVSNFMVWMSLLYPFIQTKHRNFCHALKISRAPASAARPRGSERI